MAYRRFGDRWLCSICDQPTADENDHSGCFVGSRSLGTTPATLVPTEPVVYGDVVGANVTSQQDKLLHGILGISGEAGEVADLYKKFTFQYRGRDRTATWFNEELSLELGDLLFYTALAARAGLGLTLKDLAHKNIRKLQARYPDKYINIDLERMVL